MSKFLCFLVAVMFLTESCINGKNNDGIWQNDHIDAGVRSTMAAMNKQVYDCIGNNDYPHLSQLFSDSLKTYINGDFEATFLPRMQKMLHGRPYRILGEFYIKTSKKDSVSSIVSGKGDDAFTFKILTPGRESYVSLLIAGDSANEVMLTLVYSNVKGAWKVSMIRGEDYSITQKNAIELYNKAIALRNSGDMIDAVNTMNVAIHCLRPAGIYLQYKLDAKMHSFNDSLITEVKAKYPLPYKMNAMQTGPQLFNIHYELFKGELTPMIMYQTSVSVRDSVALKIENDDLHKNIPVAFPGMNKNNKYIIYRAYNEIPEGKSDPRYYGFVLKNEP